MNNLEVMDDQQNEAVDNVELDATQALDEICLSDCNEDHGENEGVNGVEDTTPEPNVGNGLNFGEDSSINGVEDLAKVDLRNVSLEDIVKFHFPNVGTSFMFYNWYASMHGFSARKSKVLRNSNGELIQQTFLCHKEGHRSDICSTSRKREPKPTTRCGCKARCVVHIDIVSGRWYIKHLCDEHNHTFMEDKYTVMLPAHRKIDEFSKSQMSSMKEVGVRTPHIYGVLANQAGGFVNLGYLKQDLYNEQLKRQPGLSDAKSALDYLESMRMNDDMMFWRHTVDEEGRLEHLFWCDGVSRRDFSVFGDVLAFDATYRKNRYLSPLVVFSGVNHHNMSIVFAAGIVANETEQTYVWLLEQFVEAMGGKCPVSVITDGDQAMRNAIRRVFPDAHHRLCAWHLIRNATTNVKNANFVSRFKNCMLGDFDVGEFNRRWEKLVEDLGLQENLWVLQLYEKRKMWATAYIRGNFFAGFRTTSRCESLHSEFGKYVNVRNNLLDFLHHFFRWINYMRYREVEADFLSLYGEPVLQTELQSLEKSAASVYTKEVFMLFRPVLMRAWTCKVVATGQDGSCFMYKVCRYRKEGIEWIVTFDEVSLEFNCSCKRLESYGIPCEHMVSVMVFLDIVRIPETVVFKRWTKKAKDSITLPNNDQGFSRDPGLWYMYLGLLDNCYNLAKTAYECGNMQIIRKTMDMVNDHKNTLMAYVRGEAVPAADTQTIVDGAVRDPTRVRSKGGVRGASQPLQTRGQKAPRRPPKCSACGGKGHRRVVCPVQRDRDLNAENVAGPSGATDEEDVMVNIDMTVG